MATLTLALSKGRIFEETKARPAYIVGRFINIENPGKRVPGV